MTTQPAKKGESSMYTQYTTAQDDGASDEYGCYAASRIVFHLQTQVSGHPVQVCVDDLDQWIALIPSTTGRGEVYITNQRHCDCKGFQYNGSCKHVVFASQAFLNLSPIVNEIRRKTGRAASTEEYGDGMRLLDAYSVHTASKKAVA